MLSKFMINAALAVSVATAVVPAAASARDHDRYAYDGGRDYDRGDRYYDRGRDYRHDRDRRHGDYRRGYYGQQAYGGYRGNDRRYYGRRDCRSGSTGTIVGAIAGGLIGNGVAGRGDRTLGTVLGAGGGALAGRAIDRNGRGC